MAKRMHENIRGINEMKAILDRVEESILEYQLQESQSSELAEVGYWANELLQSRISYEDTQALHGIIGRVGYLQMLYLETTLDLRASQLMQELKTLIPDEAWRVYLRLDEVRGLEQEYFRGKNYRGDFNLNLVMQEQELQARLSALKLKTY